jgi:hypothetical protein
VTGQPGSHDEAKKIMAGFAGAFMDREIEPMAANAFDRERVQRDAIQQAQTYARPTVQPIMAKWTAVAAH